MTAFADAETQPLAIALDCAVPLLIEEYRQCGDPTDEDIKRVRRCAGMLAEHGDTLQYGGKRGAVAELFNALADALAVMAFCPGGVRFAGTRYEAYPRTTMTEPLKDEPMNATPTTTTPTTSSPTPPTIRKPVVKAPAVKYTPPTEAEIEALAAKLAEGDAAILRCHRLEFDLRQAKTTSLRVKREQKKMRDVLLVLVASHETSAVRARIADALGLSIEELLVESAAQIEAEKQAAEKPNGSVRKKT